MEVTSACLGTTLYWVVDQNIVTSCNLSKQFSKPSVFEDLPVSSQRELTGTAGLFQMQNLLLSLTILMTMLNYYPMIYLHLVLNSVHKTPTQTKKPKET